MNLTARQRKFMELAARDEGCCPYNMPKGSPWLKNEEINPLTDEGLIQYTIIDDAWFLTDKGKSALNVHV